ncbi:hypothetical protein NDU88_001830 [Pleurodeles waltl]|uniref:Uncharacterized protein n=1 Tax=Pleurodeles waltl TaxID=8319 RepID=A0AAV7W0L4_PLEWA|nr:hypothetical protein NDU88_001830 [Pleurodeles waltl]
MCRACCSGLRGGAAARSGAACAGGRIPEPGRPCDAILLRSMLPGEVRRRPVGRRVRRGREVCAGLLGAGGGPRLDLRALLGAGEAPAASGWNLVAATVGGRHPPVDWRPILGRIARVAGEG